MKKLLLSLLVMASTAAFSQDSVTHVSFGVTANSCLNYYGRVDSLHSKAISPFIGINFKGGVYINANAVFIHNALQSRYAATLVEGGYSFRNKRNTWAGNLSTTRFFYQDNIDLIQSAIKQSAAFSLTHLNKIVNITIGADVKLSRFTDPGAQASLDHIIKWTGIFGKGVIVVDPSVYVYAGTQHFTESFLQQKSFLGLPAGQEMLTKESSQFNILSYELSMPFVFAYHKIFFIVSPAYVLPRNSPVPVKNLFYTTASIKVTL